MKIQSLSVVVPNRTCVNNCAFCVSRMHTNDYRNQLSSNLPFYDLYLKDYLKRLEFARDNGCNTVMLTGNSEPQQNREYLMTFGLLMQIMKSPFRWIEMQTTGTLLDENYLRFLRNHVGVNTISLSVSSFDEDENNAIIGAKSPIRLAWLSSEIKKYDFTLRLSLNLNASVNGYTPEGVFDAVRRLGCDQLTLRKLYAGEEDCEQNRWIARNAYPEESFDKIKTYIQACGRPLETLPFGAVKYSVHGISTVVDEDCMSTEVKDSYKYLILRPDCKLYSKWDDAGSLIF